MRTRAVQGKTITERNNLRRSRGRLIMQKVCAWPGFVRPLRQKKELVFKQLKYLKTVIVVVLASVFWVGNGYFQRLHRLNKLSKTFKFLEMCKFDFSQKRSNSWTQTFTTMLKRTITSWKVPYLDNWTHLHKTISPIFECPKSEFLDSKAGWHNSFCHFVLDGTRLQKLINDQIFLNTIEFKLLKQTFVLLKHISSQLPQCFKSRIL